LGALSRQGSATSQCVAAGAEARWYFGPTVQPARARAVSESEHVRRRETVKSRFLVAALLGMTTKKNLPVKNNAARLRMVLVR